MFDAIFWDMDGTIVDTEHLVWEVMQRAFRAAAGIDLPQQEFSRLLGRSESDFYAHMAARHSISPAGLAKVRAAYDSEYLPRLARVPTLPGAVEKVRESEQIAPLALVTGSTATQARTVLDTLGIGPCFREIVSCDAYSRGKPDAEPYHVALRRLRAKPSRSLAIEDSPSGVSAALAAGLRVVGVHEGNKGRAAISHAHVEIPSLHELDFAALARG